MILKRGDVLLFRGNDILSRIIRYATHSEFSHAACYLGDGQIVESAIKGVEVVSLSGRDNFAVYRHFDHDTKQMEEAVDWMVEQEGKGYDYLGLFGIGLSIITKNKRNYFDDKNRYWCSELIADGYMRSGLLLDADSRTYKVSPGDLARSALMTEVESHVSF